MTRVIRVGLVLALVAWATACTTATGEVRGGQPRPGYDASSPDPLVVPVTEETYADAPPTSWRGIYRDFFGRRSRASCAGSGACHDAPDKPGSKLSNFVCEDLDGCWTSLRTAKDPDPRVSERALVEEADIADPGNAYLFKVVRLRTPDGQLVANRGMPQQPRDFAYAAEQVELIQTWIRNGAKND